MLIKNSLAGIVRTVRDASCLAFAGVLALATTSTVQADGLPYGGNVTAIISGGNLVVTGDNDHNYIRVSDASEYGGTPGDVVVWGGGRFLPFFPEAAPGEYSLVNGGLDPVFLTGFNGNVRIDTGNGADTLSFDLLHTRNATVEFGSVPDGAIATLSSNSLSVCGNLSVDKDGSGKVFSTIASSEIRGNLYIDGGSQNDPTDTWTSGVYLSQLTVHGNLSIDGGGQDVLVELSTICGNTYVETGNYQSSVVLDQLTVGGNVSADLGGLSDTIRLQSLEAHGNIAVDLGSGDDTCEILSSSACGNVSVDGEAGNDVVTLDTLTARGNVSVGLDAGDDSVNVANSTIGGNLSINGGSGTDSSVIDSTTYRKLNLKKVENHTP